MVSMLGRLIPESRDLILPVTLASSSLISWILELKYYYTKQNNKYTNDNYMRNWTPL